MQLCNEPDRLNRNLVKSQKNPQPQEKWLEKVGIIKQYHVGIEALPAGISSKMDEEHGWGCDHGPHQLDQTWGSNHLPTPSCLRLSIAGTHQQAHPAH